MPMQAGLNPLKDQDTYLKICLFESFLELFISSYQFYDNRLSDRPGEDNRTHKTYLN